MELKGEVVTHKSFGKGIVTECNDSYIVVRFEEGEKRFQFPNAFESYLFSENVLVMQYIKTLLDTDELIKRYAQLKNQLQLEVFETKRSDIVTLLKTAINNKSDIQMVYYTKSRDAITDRVVTPRRLYWGNTSLYLGGYCHWRLEYRTFKVSRIRSACIIKKEVATTREKQEPKPLPYIEPPHTPHEQTPKNNHIMWFWIVVTAIILYLLFK